MNWFYSPLMGCNLWFDKWWSKAVLYKLQGMRESTGDLAKTDSWAPPSMILLPSIRIRPWECAFLTSSPVMLMPWNLRTSLEKHSSQGHSPVPNQSCCFTVQWLFKRPKPHLYKIVWSFLMLCFSFSWQVQMMIFDQRLLGFTVSLYC